MARLLGVNVPDDKRVVISLTYIYGIGLTTSKNICSKLGIEDRVRFKDLSEADILKIRDHISSTLTVEGDLRTRIHTNIRDLIDQGTYRGLRHRRGLPARGQRTRSNAKTSKKKVHLRRKENVV